MWHDSRTLFTATLDRNPQSWTAHNGLAVADMEERHFASAEKHARAYLALASGNTGNGYVLAGEAIARRGRSDEACNLLAEGMARNPADPLIVLTLAGVNYQAGSYYESSRLLDELAAKFPNQPYRAQAEAIRARLQSKLHPAVHK